jgi:hypothetical protein
MLALRLNATSQDDLIYTRTHRVAFVGNPITAKSASQNTYMFAARWATTRCLQKACLHKNILIDAYTLLLVTKNTVP